MALALLWRFRSLYIRLVFRYTGQMKSAFTDWHRAKDIALEMTLNGIACVPEAVPFSYPVEYRVILRDVFFSRYVVLEVDNG